MIKCEYLSLFTCDFNCDVLTNHFLLQTFISMVLFWEKNECLMIPTNTMKILVLSLLHDYHPFFWTSFF
jgi:hypothetical protein